MFIITSKVSQIFLPLLSEFQALSLKMPAVDFLKITHFACVHDEGISIADRIVENKKKRCQL